MRVLSTLVFSLLAALGLYAARRRIWLALKTGAVVFLVLLPIRLLFYLPSLEGQINNLVWPAAGALLAWLVLWRASTTYQRRREARRPRRTV